MAASTGRSNHELALEAWLEAQHAIWSKPHRPMQTEKFVYGRVAFEAGVRATLPCEHVAVTRMKYHGCQKCEGIRMTVAQLVSTQYEDIMGAVGFCFAMSVWGTP